MYEISLRVVLRYRPAMLVLFVVVLFGTVRMYEIVPTGFIPDQDNDTISVNLRAAQGTSFYDMSKWTQQIADIEAEKRIDFVLIENALCRAGRNAFRPGLSAGGSRGVPFRRHRGFGGIGR